MTSRPSWRSPPRAVWTQPSKGHVFSKRWKTEQHTCPKCKFHGAVDPNFGVRLVKKRDGTIEERKQSWCADCRAGTNYHARERLVDRKARVAREALEGAVQGRRRK